MRPIDRTIRTANAIAMSVAIVALGVAAFRGLLLRNEFREGDCFQSSSSSPVYQVIAKREEESIIKVVKQGKLYPFEKGYVTKRREELFSGFRRVLCP